MTLPKQRSKCIREMTPGLSRYLYRARRQQCLMYLLAPAAILDVRISVTVQSTRAMWRRKSMTVRGAMIRCASTIPLDGGRCGPSCCNAICFVSRAAMKLAPKQTTLYRHATAARYGHWITYRGCVAAAIRERHGARTAPEGMPVILPTNSASEIRSRDACEKPQVLNFFPELTHAD